MTNYKLYQLQDGHIRTASNFEAADDRAALTYAYANILFEAVELWSGPRRVGTVAAPAQQTRPRQSAFG